MLSFIQLRQLSIPSEGWKMKYFQLNNSKLSYFALRLKIGATINSIFEDQSKCNEITFAGDSWSTLKSSSDVTHRFVLEIQI